MIEILKVHKNLSPAITADLFYVPQKNYNLRHNSYFAIPKVKSVHHGKSVKSEIPNVKSVYGKFVKFRT